MPTKPEQKLMNIIIYVSRIASEGVNLQGVTPPSFVPVQNMSSANKLHNGTLISIIMNWIEEQSPNLLWLHNP